MRVVRHNTIEPERIVPLVTTTNTQNFYMGEGCTHVKYVDHIGSTAPLKFGKQFDLLALGGQGDIDTTIDPALAIDKIYFKVNGIEYAGSVKGESGNVAQADLLSDTRRVIIDYTNDHVYMDKDRPTYWSGVDTSHIPEGVFQFKITGEVQTSRGITIFNAEVIEQSSGLDVELLGYTLAAYYAKS